MRNFLYKCILGISCLYLVGVLGLGYIQISRSIPDQIYITEGEEPHINTQYPLVMQGNVCRLFGILPIKTVEVTQVDRQTLYACGKIIGIYTKTQGVFVIDTTEFENKAGDTVYPAKDMVVTGDYILEINGEPLDNKEEMVKIVSESQGEPLELTILREQSILSIYLTPQEGKTKDFLLGIWIKDDQAGIGTLTYFTDTGDFGTLGHGMGNGENGQILLIGEGDIYNARILGLSKGLPGIPGEIKAVIAYGKSNHLGEVEANTSKGVFGEVDLDDIKSHSEEYPAYEIMHKQYIQKGKAQILSELSGELEYYDIEITYIDYLSKDNNKGIHIKITDERLLELTGGIVQGMSGSPVIQNGRIVGAVTHVLVNDPTRGYGIFIENMLEAAK